MPVNVTSFLKRSPPNVIICNEMICTVGIVRCKTHKMLRGYMPINHLSLDKMAKEGSSLYKRKLVRSLYSVSVPQP